MLFKGLLYIRSKRISKENHKEHRNSSCKEQLILSPWTETEHPRKNPNLSPLWRDAELVGKGPSELQAEAEVMALPNSVPHFEPRASKCIIRIFLKFYL